MTTLTLELPSDLYKSAKQLADVQRRPVEQVIVDHLYLPDAQATLDIFPDIAVMGFEELAQVATTTTTPEAQERFEYLQERCGRELASQEEEAEIFEWVAQEGERVLRRAQALYLLKISGRSLPPHIAQIIHDIEENL